MTTDLKASDDDLNLVFSALSDPTRRSILERLSRGEASVGELAEPFDMSLPAISKHLGVLEHAGLLSRERDGRFFRCLLHAEPMRNAALWMERYRRFWSQQFDALEAYLSQEDLEVPTDREENEDG
ncbi:MAG: metalloregulator ArsR/SmtB family transcription factor [Chloroflexi bacterium]|nr:metalloregulator ArsR/SmtB family transcription factor [Chloroflexota bacterium]